MIGEERQMCLHNGSRELVKVNDKDAADSPRGLQRGMHLE